MRFTVSALGMVHQPELRSYGFSAKELNTIRAVIIKNKNKMLERWYEHFGSNTGSEN